MGSELTPHEALARISTKTLTYFVGLPGSGKSTLAHLISACGHVTPHAIVSTDTFREMIGDSRTWTKDDCLVFTTVASILEARLRNELSAIYDATNTAIARRLEIQALANATGSKTIAVWMNYPEDFCRHRRLRSGIVYDENVWSELSHGMACYDPRKEGADWVSGESLHQVLLRNQ
jgi:predicted kinase